MAIENKPDVKILISLIEVWDLEDIDDVNAEPSNDVLYLAEVENVTIEDTYKKVICTAKVRFPRGTVLHRNTQSIDTYGTVTASVTDQGIIATTSNNSTLLDTSDFKMGQRIRIYLAYTTDPEVANYARATRAKNIFNDTEIRTLYKENLEEYFNGYITGISLETPVELECENLASYLKKKTCPNVPAGSSLSVNTLLADDGEYQLLKGSGLSLYPATKSCDITLAGIELSNELTVADLLQVWSRYHVYAYVKYSDGTPYLAVGRIYFSSADKDSIVEESGSVPDILFDYHVVENGLTTTATDKAYLAVDANAFDSDGRQIHVTVRRSPTWEEGDDVANKYQKLNETTLTKKAQKARTTTQAGAEVSLENYSIIPYTSPNMNITTDELFQEAVKYLEGANMNGISGSLTLFGDLHIQSGMKVHLYDSRYTVKNGNYVVEGVETTFGTNGFRQQINLPYCVGRDATEEEEETE